MKKIDHFWSGFLEYEQQNEIEMGRELKKTLFEN